MTAHQGLLSPCHHDHAERVLVPHAYDPERMRWMIHIILFFEIFISCIPRSEWICFTQWANQPSRIPRNRSPTGWRTEGVGRLVKGMPDVSPT